MASFFLNTINSARYKPVPDPFKQINHREIIQQNVYDSLNNDGRVVVSIADICKKHCLEFFENLEIV